MIGLEQFIEKINAKTKFIGAFRYDEPMALHTTFKVGGPADIWIKPGAEIFPDYAALLLDAAQSEGIPVFILGGGANLVVSDRGIRGIVLDTGNWSGCTFVTRETAGEALIRGGTPADGAAEAAAAQGWGGLEFLAGMPGSIGGAVWMNARCYEKSVSDGLLGIELLDENLNRTIVPFRAEEYGYKKSPFQTRKVLILSGKFILKKRSPAAIQQDMETYRQDRERKGHYRFPSAGSAFKNNRDFGKPTGKILDELGFRGFAMGGAAVAPWHGNIIINTGNATAADIQGLVKYITAQVKMLLGIELEPEILFVGEGIEPAA
jgi:UDP-N-acetylmuramate dehydrogenase